MKTVKLALVGCGIALIGTSIVQAAELGDDTAAAGAGDSDGARVHSRLSALLAADKAAVEEAARRLQAA